MSDGPRMQWAARCQRSKSDAGGRIPRSRCAREIEGGRRAHAVDGAGMESMGRAWRTAGERCPSTSAPADTSWLERPVRWRAVRATRGYAARICPAAV
ncbi:hypothetical protein B0H10DRAFT_2118041 [Mycena sp. CBHHK59/15]|nr:hypothetical protein B0H10DRAFT_2118041 [Mycena sp. CBHHK59/15]